jgi:hypothetical protein
VESQQAEVKRWREEINNWNLINGLHLSGEQIEAIVAVYAAPPPKRGARTLSWEEATVVRERSVERILNPGQREVLADYKACLLPPKDLKNPVRIGQATTNSPADRWLARARKAPEERLEELIDRAIAREDERLGPLEPADEWARRILLRRTARRAAQMSDVDFELNRAELAELISRPDPADELKTRIEYISRSRGKPGRIASFMLKDSFIRQLRQRGRQLAEDVEHTPADLTEGPKAETYEPGWTMDGGS